MLLHYLWKIKISNLLQIWKQIQTTSNEPVQFSRSFTWSFTWCGHTSPDRSTCAAVGLVGRQSSKKPIWCCFILCNSLLKLFTVYCIFTVYWLKLFHRLTSRSVKKCRLTFKFVLCLASLNSWPLSCLLVERSNMDSGGTPDRPLTILKTSIRSALLRRSSKLQSPSRSLYGSLENPGIILVKRCCTFSINILSFW